MAIKPKTHQAFARADNFENFSMMFIKILIIENNLIAPQILPQKKQKSS